MKKTRRIYLDNNAGTFLDPQISADISYFLNNFYGNPSSIHSFGRDSKKIYETCREQIASFCGIKSTELIFTSSGSEAINLLIEGFLKRRVAGHIITSNVEHISVQKTLKRMEARGFELTYLTTGLHGAIDPEELRLALRPDTCLITFMAANNETGVKNDLTKIAEIAQFSQIPLVVDAIAYFGKVPCTILKGVSAMAFSGHKIHALQGVGAAFIRSEFKIDPLIEGGGQEFGKKAGTENLLGVYSFAKAIELLKESLSEDISRMESLRNRLETCLQKELSGVLINGLGPRVCNTSNLSFEGVDGETLLIALDQEGIAVSHGSACSSGGREPSRVLLNMGIPLKRVRSSIRVSLSRMTTEEEIDLFVEALLRIIPKLRDRK